MKHYDTMTGYKATDANMKCREFQYELGKWYRHEGDLKLCESGFHFCVYPSGPWSFYNYHGIRIFKVEAKDVWVEYEAGSGLEVVCRDIRLIEEVKIGSDQNTGNKNTGDKNTGHWNTGDWNTGHWNATNRACGMFCQEEPKAIVFDVQSDLTFFEFLKAYPRCCDLGNALNSDAPFDYNAYATIPGWTLEKCRALHEKFIAARKAVLK